MVSCFVNRTVYGYKMMCRIFIEFCKFLINGILTWKCDRELFVILSGGISLVISMLMLLANDVVYKIDHKVAVFMIFVLPCIVIIAMCPIYYAVYECYIDKEV